MELSKERRSLEEVFISTFHEKVNFDDFVNFSINKEYKTFEVNRRKIYAPSKKLKQFQRFINSSILEYADYNRDVVYSYRKGVSIRDAVEKHASSNFFYQTDISDFFGSITGDDIMKVINTSLLNVPVSDVLEYKQLLFELMVVDNNLPAGFATSPLLSNITLVDFDNALKKYCDRSNIIYTRYSDDLIISSVNEGFVDNINEVIKSFLHEHMGERFNLNYNKTKVRRKGQKVKILGFTILPNGIITISKSYKEEVESLLYFYLNDTDKFSDYVKNKINPRDNQIGDRTFEEFGISSLSGKLIAISSMDSLYISKLRKKYGNTIIEMFLRKTVN
ncbi:reverse transcriptase domain-containing protein [Shewanella ulleungensis]|uniref:RNA-directed DNA polymerase n=1 Tax=Shewanella ulleungensis TaxID=2282699 RepID=A0ABQ2QI22_9GAMM|nr:reverse transcriptase domain-containing protein [Shewanella ulleungensis]MCL1149810.1 reverse transcriptase family protein [Shewanella ulleungensis]GGP81499.1 hypothetical protein GCM10009410_13140 [Shewanella ulleungensis]